VLAKVSFPLFKGSEVIKPDLTLAKSPLLTGVKTPRKRAAIIIMKVTEDMISFDLLFILLVPYVQ
jgi:hypothetical protein